MEPISDKTATTTAGPDQPELSWTALLEAYRVGPKEKWSGVLVERLGPWLASARQRLFAVPPYLDDEDVAQELVFVVLRIAARWRPRCEDRWVPRKLVEAAEDRVRAWLCRERSSQTDELTDELRASEVPEPELVLDTPIGKASVEDLRLIYRVKVLGEPISALAQRAGISPRQMRHRVKEARERARAAVSAAGDRP
jgi:DNA-directed RNA polymerase specialized sigma24 family protein